MMGFGGSPPESERDRGRSSARQSISFARRGSQVRILSPPPARRIPAVLLLAVTQYNSLGPILLETPLVLLDGSVALIFDNSNRGICHD